MIMEDAKPEQYFASATCQCRHDHVHLRAKRLLQGDRQRAQPGKVSSGSVSMLQTQQFWHFPQ
jgi:myosin-crossreactive antigen